MTLNLDNIDEQFLARWARARIAADAATLADELDHNDDLVDGANCAIGLSVEAAAVLFRDVDTNAVYTLAPPDTVIGQAPDGRHVSYRGGAEIIPPGRIGAAHLN